MRPWYEVLDNKDKKVFSCRDEKTAREWAKAYRDVKKKNTLVMKVSQSNGLLMDEQIISYVVNQGDR
jgi:hypothetical protein